MFKIYKPVFLFSVIFFLIYLNSSSFAQDYEIKKIHVFKGSEDWVVISQQMGKDFDGNIFNFSTFKGTIKNANGIYSTLSPGNSNILITRFNNEGDISRNIHIDYTDFDKATDVAISHKNEYYVSGTFHDYFRADSSIILIKSDEYGKVLWDLKVSGGKCMGQGVCVDDEGNCYVTGYIYDSLCIGEYRFISNNKTKNYGSFIIKLSSEGKILWAKATSVQRNKIDVSEASFHGYPAPHLHAIRYNKDGFLYFVGHFIAHANLDSFNIFSTKTFSSIRWKYTENYYIGKLNKKGEIQWLTNENSAERSGAYFLNLDKDGNIYVMDGLIGGNYKIIKYNNNGRWQWNLLYYKDRAATVNDNGKIFIPRVGLFTKKEDRVLMPNPPYINLPDIVHSISDAESNIFIKGYFSKEITGDTLNDSSFCIAMLKIPQPKDEIVIPAVEYPEFSLYPNPADQIINIDLNSENEEKIKITISDLQGRILYNSNATKPTGKVGYYIPLYKFRAGIYIVQVKAGEKLYKEKLIKL